MAKLLVSDFDGVWTDTEEEAEDYVEGVIKDVAMLVGVPIHIIREDMKKFNLDVKNNPNDYGFFYNQKKVASASDPYIRTACVVRKVFDKYGMFQDEGFRDRILVKFLFGSNYEKAGTVFRPHAREVMQKLCRTNTFIVSNSDTKSVVGKIKTLGRAGNGEVSQWSEEMMKRVIGGAKKYKITDDFDAVPEFTRIAGLNRHIWLRREAYYKILNDLRKEFGLEFSDIAVAGDIFELDLVLPLELGCVVALLPTKYTPRCEIEAVQNNQRGCIITDLRQLPTLFH